MAASQIFEEFTKHFLNHQHEAIAVVEVGFCSRVSQSPVGQLARLSLQHRRDADLQQLPSRNKGRNIETEGDLQAICSVSALGERGCDRSFPFPALAIVVEVVNVPIARGGEVDLPINWCILQSQKAFKASALPEAIATLGGWGKLGKGKALQIAAELIGDVEVIGLALYLSCDRAVG